MLKLTQCMIIKNEERNLNRALSWGKGIFDETIVVDTGSTDGSVALAESLGAKVVSFDWINDFSAARNFAISQCSGEWIFFLDADEYIEDNDVKQLRPLAEKIDKLYDVTDGKKLYYNVIETPWINYIDGDTSVSRQARIFKNVTYLRYSGAVHEQLHALPGGYIKVYRVQESPAIHHTGYMWSKDNNREEKGALYSEIAKKSIEASPESAKLKLFAAEALMSQGEYAEAEKYFREAMKNSDGSIWTDRLQEGYKQWLSLYMKLGNTEKEIINILEPAIRIYTEAVTKFPDDADFDILISMLFFKAKDIDNTICFFRSSLSKKNGKITNSLSGSPAYKKLLDISQELKD